jgi:hypothetical protein
MTMMASQVEIFMVDPPPKAGRVFIADGVTRRRGPELSR